MCRLNNVAANRNMNCARPTTVCMATQEKAEIIFSPFQEVGNSIMPLPHA